MLVGVGSKNPAKVRAVTRVFRKAFPKARVLAFSVPSGVSRMPLSSEETMRGAERRARHLLRNHPEVDIAVGVEDGAHLTRRGAMLCSYTCVMDRNGRTGIGGGTSAVLPEKAAKLISGGEELGVVIDRMTGRRRVNEKEGAIGVLTANLVDREALFRFTTACALAPFLKKGLYG